MKESIRLIFLSIFFLIGSLFIKGAAAIILLIFALGHMIAYYIVKELEDIKEILKEKE
jgi:hypothetical protein